MEVEVGIEFVVGVGVVVGVVAVVGFEVVAEFEVVVEVGIGVDVGFVVVAGMIADNSLLKDTICTTRALLRHHHGYTSREDSAALKAGSAAHAALAAYLDPQGLGTDIAAFALDVFKREYAAWSRANVDPGNRLSYENTSRILAAWFDAHPIDSFPFRVRHVEIGFTMPLTDWLTICGRLDGEVEMLSDKSIFVLEWKTTGNITPWWLADFRMSSQLSTYISGLREHLGGARVAGGILGAIEFSKIPGSASRCREHGTPYSECGVQHVVKRAQMVSVERQPAQLTQWRRDAIRAARRYADACETYSELGDLRHAPMEGTFYNGCSNCAFKDFCEAGRPIELIDSMLVHDPWNPLAHSETGQVTTR